MRLLIDILLTVVRYMPCDGITFWVRTAAFQMRNSLTVQEVIYGFGIQYSRWEIRFRFMNDIFILKAKITQFCGIRRQWIYLPMETG